MGPIHVPGAPLQGPLRAVLRRPPWTPLYTTAWPRGKAKHV